jgi:hypothetical protein
LCCVTDLLDDESWYEDFSGGDGDPAGIIPRAGTGVGQNFSPTEFTGTGAGKISTRGDGDGELFPDGEFPIAIPRSNRPGGRSDRLTGLTAQGAV